MLRKVLTTVAAVAVTAVTAQAASAQVVSVAVGRPWLCRPCVAPVVVARPVVVAQPEPVVVNQVPPPVVVPPPAPPVVVTPPLPVVAPVTLSPCGEVTFVLHHEAQRFASRKMREGYQVRLTGHLLRWHVSYSLPCVR
jgi:hypothetical protein